MLKRLTEIYPRVWPILFLAGGIVSAIWGSHLHLRIFGEMVMVNLHTWMWFLMALAHADVFWRRRRRASPPDEASQPEQLGSVAGRERGADAE